MLLSLHPHLHTFVSNISISTVAHPHSQLPSLSHSGLQPRPKMQSPISSPLLMNMCPSLRNYADSPEHMVPEEGSSPPPSTHEIYAFIALSLDKAFQGNYKKMEEHMLEVWRESTLRDLECGFSPGRTLPLTAAQMEILCRKTQPIRENILGEVERQQEFLTEEQRNDALKVRFENLVEGECLGTAEQALELWKHYHQSKGSQESFSSEKDNDMVQQQEHEGFFARLFGGNVPWRDNAQPTDVEALKSATRYTSRAIQMSAPIENDRKPKYWLSDVCGQCTVKATFGIDDQPPCRWDCCEGCWKRKVKHSRWVLFLTLGLPTIYMVVIVIGQATSKKSAGAD